MFSSVILPSGFTFALIRKLDVVVLLSACWTLCVAVNVGGILVLLVAYLFLVYGSLPDDGFHIIDVNIAFCTACA